MKAALILLTFYSEQSQPIEVSTFYTMQDCQEVAYFIQSQFKDESAYFTCEPVEGN